MNYIKSLSKEHRNSLAEYLGTNWAYLRHYSTGKKFPAKKRIVKIIEWAQINTPSNVPDFREFIEENNSHDN